MVSITNPPERIKLQKAVERAFEKENWIISKRRAEHHDFLVEKGSLNFLVKCMDETRIIYDSSTKIVTTLEGYAREHRHLRNRQLIVVFDRNFLGIPLESLIEREIFALTFDEIPLVTGLAGISHNVPEGLLPRQTYLIEHCLQQCIFISGLHWKAKNTPESIAWGRRAMDLSVGYTNALPHLFNLLKAAREYEEAEHIGQRIMQFRPDDPKSIQGMADLARRRGDAAEAQRWEKRLTEQRTAPRTLEDILSKQRQQAQQPNPEAKAEVPAENALPQSRLGRLFTGLRRTASS
ncbi:MAG TPA: hypothetical protein VL752_09535 [Acidisoma sp.]|jgi:hypothetical protein|uniref:tetratricopeptide repeat protein n=1 Tax=Acidisoma sp. TaxID=1872115 RepID=UPI002C712EB1|nr:hypothetical protein [Acidisoma sp.]HTI01174.1 hypothetical protein [Acidisoma sp.]